MQTQIAPSKTQAILAVARAEQRMTTREFAAELGVSQNAVFQWESGQASPTPDRIAAWIKDERRWVRAMGLEVFAIRYGAVIENILVRPLAA